jgi:hypothetical protein
MLERTSRRAEHPAAVARAPSAPQLVPSSHLLARQGDPQPGEAGHQQAFDTFVSGLFAGSDPAHLIEVRTACDAAATPSNATLDYNGNRLVVDQRNRTAVMTRIRWRAMDRIHELSEKHGATERTAADEAGRVAARKLLLDESKPYLDFLKGEIQDPQSRQNRFEHWYDVVQRSVLRVLELLAVEDAQTTGLKPDGTGKTKDELKDVKKIADMGSEPWCGAFASVAMTEAGISPSAVGRAQLDGEGGILSFMAYQDLISKKKIKVGGESMSVRDFHASRNSLRRTQVIANADGSAGFTAPPGAEIVARGAVEVNPGDILLLDNRAGNRPDHVMIATSSDIGAMTKIAGNETATPGGQVASGGNYDIRNQPDAISAADQAKYDKRLSLREKKKAHEKDPAKPWTPADETALADVEAKVTAFEAAHPKQSRIAAVCRFSIVDFEVHDYV